MRGKDKGKGARGKTSSTYTRAVPSLSMLRAGARRPVGNVRDLFRDFCSAFAAAVGCREGVPGAMGDDVMTCSSSRTKRVTVAKSGR